MGRKKRVDYLMERVLDGSFFNELISEDKKEGEESGESLKDMLRQALVMQVKRGFERFFEKLKEELVLIGNLLRSDAEGFFVDAEEVDGILLEHLRDRSEVAYYLYVMYRTKDRGDALKYGREFCKVLGIDASKADRFYELFDWFYGRVEGFKQGVRVGDVKELMSYELGRKVMDVLKKRQLTTGQLAVKKKVNARKNTGRRR